MKIGGIDLKFWATTFTLTGTVIGAGILGLPYVFSRSGFFIGVFWLLLLGAIMIFVNLCLAEVSLRTKQNHQLPGYAKKYLGKWGKRLMFFAMIFGVYSALIAYLIGEGQSFSQIFFGSVDYAIYFGIAFWIIMTVLLNEGLRGLKKVELYGVFTIIVIIVGMFFYFLQNVDVSNLFYVNYSNFFFPFGVVLFALLGFSSIPELRMEIRGQEKKLKKAIFIGALIPIILYILFSLVFVGALGDKAPEVATLAFGSIVIVLGIFTMMTSYFVLSFALKDIFRFDFYATKRTGFIFVSIFPLVLYLLISYFKLAGFIEVLGIGGVISGGLTGILALIINKRAKKLGERKPEFQIPINWWIIGILSVIFVLGIITELVL